MGLVTRHGLIAVKCMKCGFRGQHFSVDPNAPTAQDKAAFDAWNDEARLGLNERSTIIDLKCQQFEGVTIWPSVVNRLI